MASESRRGVKKAPSKPQLRDEYGATNRRLWRVCLEVASGKRRDYTEGGRTIHAPNEGRGYRDMPANPKGIAWAVKQYNGFGGAWRAQREAAALSPEQCVLAQGGVVLGPPGDFAGLEARGLVRLAGTSGERSYWEATRKGRRVLLATLVDDLSRRMEQLFANFDPREAQDLATWILANFRIDSPKTPSGGKAVKEKMQRLVWVLKNRYSQSQKPDPDGIVAELRRDWDDVAKNLGSLTKFTDEGGTVVPREWNHDGILYMNDAGVIESTFDKYVKRLAAVFSSVTGWRIKALKGQLTVVLKPPSAFRGTVSGKYMRAGDQLWVRTTPAILRRAQGYASFEYILIHELGHRYERYHRLPVDFDRPEWWTSRYSRDEGESFAELFAIGHFDYAGSWDRMKVERFEALMSGQKEG